VTQVQDKVVVIAGATSASGRAVARALVAAGARVLVVGTHRGRLDELEVEIPGVIGEQADLSAGDDVLELAMRVHAKVGDVDGIVHLVGGWRGGGGIAGQTEEDYRVLEHSFTALRYVSRVFFDDLEGSDTYREQLTHCPECGRELERKPKRPVDTGIDAILQTAQDKDGVLVVVQSKHGLDPDSLRDMSDTVRQKLGNAVVVLASESDGRVHVVAHIAPSAVAPGVNAGGRVLCR
jgi:hypothetical protein